MENTNKLYGKKLNARLRLKTKIKTDRTKGILCKFAASYFLTLL